MRRALLVTALLAGCAAPSRDTVSAPETSLASRILALVEVDQAAREAWIDALRAAGPQPGGDPEVRRLAEEVERVDAETAVFLVELLDERRFVTAVEETLQVLAQHPDLGLPRVPSLPSLQGLRSFPGKGFGRHLVFYRPLDGMELRGVAVLRVLHGARDLGAPFEL